MAKLEMVLKVIDLDVALFNKAQETNLSDEQFSKSEEIKEIAFKIIELLKNCGEKVSYNNLTNMNFHLLVKVLNYNDFFNKTLKKDLREELKKLPIKK